MSNRDKMLEFLENGVMGYEEFAEAALKFMSEHDVAKFIKLYELETDDEDDFDDSEFAMQQGMAFGTDGYNDAMGYDISTPEPCGHHCGSDCPRCGD
jgi:hypothetical protein